ncbi:hypothetical protein ALC60_02547 [Trachymyrmex zeteki]|uniref:Uncharacterized protein n=1 Tax=Mycetomoellerius zeteki TaxID=64791 RepID=A0A151XDT2_9HYME|nr:hypothetical protein ALC60_02547 [Trachymyrmex zeteki]
MIERNDQLSELKNLFSYLEEHRSLKGYDGLKTSRSSALLSKNGTSVGESDTMRTPRNPPILFAYLYSSTFSRVACRQAREGDMNTERTGIPRNSRLTEFVVRASAVCMQQTAIQSDSSRFRCTCCPPRTACAWDCT